VEGVARGQEWNPKVKKQGSRRQRGRGRQLPASRVGVLQEGVEGRGSKEGGKIQREMARNGCQQSPSWITWELQTLSHLEAIRWCHGL